jgi:hypothetical protein
MIRTQVQENRSEIRLGYEQEVTIRELGGGRSVRATLQDLSGRGAGLVAVEAMEVNTAVRVEYGDRMLLGEVCYCVAEGERYRLGLQLRHSLAHLADLARLRARLLGEESR